MKALQGQSLVDIAVQKVGAAEAAYDIARLNGVSITDDAFVHELSIPEVQNKDIAAYYATKNINPATASDEITGDISRIFFEELPIEFM